MDGNSSPDRAATPDRPATGIYLSDVLGMLRRRWYVVLVGLLLVAGGTGAAYLKAPLNYQATGQLLLLLPPQAAGEQPINPYLNLDPGLATTASLIASTMNAPESKRSVEADGHTAEYSIALSPETGPLLVITTESRDPREAIETRDEVIRRLQQELKRIQTEEDAPKRQFIHTRTNGTFNEAEVLTGDRIRAVAAVAAAGTLAVLLVIVVWDRIAARARSRPGRRRSAVAAAADGTGKPADQLAGGAAGGAAAEKRAEEPAPAARRQAKSPLGPPSNVRRPPVSETASVEEYEPETIGSASAGRRN